MSEKALMQNIVDLLAQERKITKREAETFVKALFDLIEEALEKDQYIKIKGLGAFKLININSRESINVNTGERFVIEGHTRISFTPDPVLRDLINKPFAHFETVLLNDNVTFGDTPEEKETEDDEDFEEETATASGSKDEPDVINEFHSENVDNRKAEIHETKDNEAEAPVTEPEQTSGSIPAEENIPVCESIPIDLNNNPSKEENKNTENMKPEDKQGLPYFIAIVAITIVVLSGVIIYAYNPKMLLDMLPKSNQENTEAVDTIKKPAATQITTQIIQKDTLKGDSAKTAEESQEMPFDKVLREVREDKGNKAIREEVITKETKTEKKKTNSSLEPVHPNYTDYQIIGTKTTYTLQPGETLIMVSKRFYGTKDLWPYIVEHNSDIIKNPDKIPFGITVKVPELKKK